MNACFNCASLLPDDARFCNSCGEPVPVEEIAEPEPPAASEAEPAPPAAAPAAAPPAIPAVPDAPIAPDPPAGASPPAAGAPDHATSPPPPAAAHPFAAFGPSEAPAGDEPSESRAPVVPQARVVPTPPPPPPSPAFVTYNALPPSTPPVDTSALFGAHLEAAKPAAEPEAPAAPPPVAPVAETLPPKAPEPPPKPPKPPREPLSRGAVVAGVVTAVLLISSGVAFLLLRGGEEPKPAAALSTPAAPEPTETATRAPADADLRAQVLTLDDLMQKSKEGRTAAAQGNTKAAIANRSALLKDLQSLRGQAEDAKLKAGLASFVAAIRESLRQNRECGDACPASDIEKVNGLKSETVDALNPLLRKYAKTSYRDRDI